jgi:hypothetical protein
MSASGLSFTRHDRSSSDGPAGLEAVRVGVAGEEAILSGKVIVI